MSSNEAKRFRWIELTTNSMLFCCGILIWITLYTGLNNLPNQSVTIYVNKQGEGLMELAIMTVLLTVSLYLMARKIKEIFKEKKNE